MILRDTYREPRSTRLYIPTGKDVTFQAGSKEQAYWMLSGWVPATGATLADIYHSILGPKGLSLDDTKALVQGALESGYLK
jgi:hypothetical protein